MDQTEYERLLGYSIRFVSFRPRSEKEFRDFLARKLKKTHTYADPSVMEKVISRMRDLGYLDDRKFAAWWIEQRQSFKPKGSRLVAMELQARGVSRDVVAEFVSKDSTSGANTALLKKIPSWKSYPMDIQKKKANEFLLRRGFDWDTISRVVDAMVTKVIK